MAEKLKRVGEVFADYKTNSNIKYAHIQSLNVNKKTNALGIILEIDEYVEVKEIWYLEKFLMERFNFNNIDMQIKYTDKVEIKSIKDEWKNIICYIAHKYPLAKPMLLMNADIDIVDNKINVKMHLKGADFLRAKKSDKLLEKIIQKLMGKEYKIDLQEELKQDEIKKIKESVKRIEEQEVNKVMKQLEHAKNAQENSIPSFEQETSNLEDTNYIPPQDSDMPYIPEDVNYQMENEVIEEEQVLILGKQTKAKENRVKIKEITPSDARITLEGRISNCEKRLTKSEKVLLIFELFDGTGVITCKSFTIPEEANEIIEKLEKSNTVKLVGKANLDAYAGDVTVIANTIYQTNNNSIPKKEDFEEVDTPLILGVASNIQDKITKISELSAEDRKSHTSRRSTKYRAKRIKIWKNTFKF